MFDQDLKDLLINIDETSDENFAFVDETPSKKTISWKSGSSKAPSSEKIITEDIDSILKGLRKSQTELEEWRSFVADFTKDNPPKGNSKEFAPRFIVLSSGGMKGLFLPPVGYVVEKFGKLNETVGVAGTSIGSIMAGLYALGFTFEEILDRSYGYDIQNLISNIDLSNVQTKGCVMSQSCIVDFVSSCIEEKFDMEDITLLELFKKTNRLFICNAVSRREKRTVYINHLSRPDWTLTEAICASACYPVFFEEFEKDDDKFLDGGLFSSYLMEVYPPDETLGFYLGRRLNDGYSPVSIGSKHSEKPWLKGLLKIFRLLGECYSLLSSYTEINDLKKYYELHANQLPREIQIVVESDIKALSLAAAMDNKDESFLKGMSIGMYYVQKIWPTWSIKST